MSTRLYNRFDNYRLYRANKHSTVCQTGCESGLTTGLTTVLNEQPLFVQPVVKPGCTTGLTTGCIGLTTGCIMYTNIYPVSSRFDNRIDNRLYRVNGALETRKCSSMANVRSHYTGSITVSLKKVMYIFCILSPSRSTRLWKPFTANIFETRNVGQCPTWWSPCRT